MVVVDRPFRELRGRASELRKHRIARHACLYCFAKWSSVKRIAIDVFPTAPSPNKITLYCSCSGSSSESSMDFVFA